MSLRAFPISISIPRSATRRLLLPEKTGTAKTISYKRPVTAKHHSCQKAGMGCGSPLVMKGFRVARSATRRLLLPGKPGSQRR